MANSRIKELAVRIDDPAHTGAAGRLSLTASRYSFDYEDRLSANRYVLSAIHQFGDNGYAGIWKFELDALGRITQQKDAAKNDLVVRRIGYDPLGRIQSETRGVDEWTWHYDTESLGIGKVANVSLAGKYQRSYHYDSVGRVQTTTETVDGEDLITSTEYDSYGRVLRESLAGPSSDGFSVMNKYDSKGFLTSVSDLAETVHYWARKATDTFTEGTTLLGGFDNQWLNRTRAALVGGTAAEIGGGSFANGAVTGAFSYILNHEADQGKPVEESVFTFKLEFAITDPFGIAESTNLTSDPQFSVHLSPLDFSPEGHLDLSLGISEGSEGLGFHPTVGYIAPARLLEVNVGAGYQSGGYDISGTQRVINLQMSEKLQINFQRMYQNVTNQIQPAYQFLNNGIIQWMGAGSYMH